MAESVWRIEIINNTSVIYNLYGLARVEPSFPFVYKIYEWEYMADLLKKSISLIEDLTEYILHFTILGP